METNCTTSYQNVYSITNKKNIINGTWNIALLTSREHFVAHVLLYKHYKKIFGEHDERTFKLYCPISFRKSRFKNQFKTEFGRNRIRESNINRAARGELYFQINNPMKNPEIVFKMLKTRNQRKAAGLHKKRVFSVDEKSAISKRMQQYNPVFQKTKEQLKESAAKKMIVVLQKLKSIIEDNGFSIEEWDNAVDILYKSGKIKQTLRYKTFLKYLS